MKKYALVTGAASGFGLEFSKRLASDGFNLIIIDINEPALQATRYELIEKYHVEVIALAIDLAVPNCSYGVFYKIRHLPVEILINNAGYGLCGFFYSTDWSVEERMIEVHVETLTHLTKLILPGMISRKSGKIMNVSSLAAFQPGPLMAVYYATKAYILSFTEALANELKGTGVTATVFCPGQTSTNFQKTVAEYSNTKQSETNWMTAELSSVAKVGYKAMMAGKHLSVPGIMNNAIMQMNRLVPRKFAAGVVRQIQGKIRE